MTGLVSKPNQTWERKGTKWALSPGLEKEPICFQRVNLNQEMIRQDSCLFCIVWKKHNNALAFIYLLFFLGLWRPDVGRAEQPRQLSVLVCSCLLLSILVCTCSPLPISWLDLRKCWLCTKADLFGKNRSRRSIWRNDARGKRKRTGLVQTQFPDTLARLCGRGKSLCCSVFPRKLQFQRGCVLCEAVCYVD